jgi:pyrroline-5-carboxylate reductase
MTAQSPTVVLVGCGNMGGALLAGWLAAGRVGTNAAVVVVEPSEASTAPFRGNASIRIVAGATDLPSDLMPSVVVFAVKPQTMETVVPAYRHLVRPGTVFLSIAAGRTLGFLATQLGADAAVVRAMPNTPAAVGRGISVACPSNAVTPAQRSTCDGLLSAVGEVAWVDDEALLDPVTAVSGSGPAYVFLLAECLEEAGIAAGLPPDLARRLARATVAGSGELLQRSTTAADQLRRNVTSPKGTTAAALDILMTKEGGLQALLTRAVAAATKRSRELAG